MDHDGEYIHHKDGDIRKAINLEQEKEIVPPKAPLKKIKNPAKDEVIRYKHDFDSPQIDSSLSTHMSSIDYDLERVAELINNYIQQLTDACYLTELDIVKKYVHLPKQPIDPETTDFIKDTKEKSLIKKNNTSVPSSTVSSGYTLPLLHRDGYASTEPSTGVSTPLTDRTEQSEAIILTPRSKTGSSYVIYDKTWKPEFLPVHPYIRDLNGAEDDLDEDGKSHSSKKSKLSSQSTTTSSRQFAPDLPSTSASTDAPQLSSLMYNPDSVPIDGYASTSGKYIHPHPSSGVLTPPLLAPTTTPAALSPYTARPSISSKDASQASSLDEAFQFVPSSSLHHSTVDYHQSSTRTHPLGFHIQEASPSIPQPQIPLPMGDSVTQSTSTTTQDSATGKAQMFKVDFKTEAQMMTSLIEHLKNVKGIVINGTLFESPLGNSNGVPLQRMLNMLGVEGRIIEMGFDLLMIASLPLDVHHVLVESEDAEEILEESISMEHTADHVQSIKIVDESISMEQPKRATKTNAVAISPRDSSNINIDRGTHTITTVTLLMRWIAAVEDILEKACVVDIKKYALTGCTRERSLVKLDSSSCCQHHDQACQHDATLPQATQCKDIVEIEVEEEIEEEQWVEEEEEEEDCGYDGQQQTIESQKAELLDMFSSGIQSIEEEKKGSISENRAVKRKKRKMKKVKKLVKKKIIIHKTISGKASTTSTTSALTSLSSSLSPSTAAQSSATTGQTSSSVDGEKGTLSQQPTIQPLAFPTFDQPDQHSIAQYSNATILPSTSTPSAFQPQVPPSVATPINNATASGSCSSALSASSVPSSDDTVPSDHIRGDANDTDVTDDDPSSIYQPSPLSSVRHCALPLGKSVGTDHLRSSHEQSSSSDASDEDSDAAKSVPPLEVSDAFKGHSGMHATDMLIPSATDFLLTEKEMNHIPSDGCDCCDGGEEAIERGEASPFIHYDRSEMHLSEDDRSFDKSPIEGVKANYPSQLSRGTSPGLADESIEDETVVVDEGKCSPRVNNSVVRFHRHNNNAHRYSPPSYLQRYKDDEESSNIHIITTIRDDSESDEDSAFSSVLIGADKDRVRSNTHSRSHSHSHKPNKQIFSALSSSSSACVSLQTSVPPTNQGTPWQNTSIVQTYSFPHPVLDSMTHHPIKHLHISPLAHSLLVQALFIAKNKLKMRQEFLSRSSSTTPTLLNEEREFLSSCGGSNHSSARRLHRLSEDTRPTPMSRRRNGHVRCLSFGGVEFKGDGSGLYQTASSGTGSTRPSSNVLTPNSSVMFSGSSTIARKSHLSNPGSRSGSRHRRRLPADLFDIKELQNDIQRMSRTKAEPKPSKDNNAKVNACSESSRKSRKDSSRKHMDTLETLQETSKALFSLEKRYDDALDREQHIPHAPVPKPKAILSHLPLSSGDNDPFTSIAYASTHEMLPPPGVSSIKSNEVTVKKDNAKLKPVVGSLEAMVPPSGIITLPPLDDEPSDEVLSGAGLLDLLGADSSDPVPVLPHHMKKKSNDVVKQGSRLRSEFIKSSTMDSLGLSDPSTSLNDHPSALLPETLSAKSYIDSSVGHDTRQPKHNEATVTSPLTTSHTKKTCDSSSSATGKRTLKNNEAKSVKSMGSSGPEHSSSGKPKSNVTDNEHQIHPPDLQLPMKSLSPEHKKHKTHRSSRTKTRDITVPKPKGHFETVPDQMSKSSGPEDECKKDERKAPKDTKRDKKKKKTSRTHHSSRRHPPTHQEIVRTERKSPPVMNTHEKLTAMNKKRSARHMPIIEDFLFIDEINCGGFGAVVKVYHKITRRIYAMKVLNKNDIRRKNQIQRVKEERQILANTDNSFIVDFFYSFQNRKYLFFVMEYCNGGSIHSLLSVVGALPENIVKQYIAEVVLAIEYLHKNGVVHRDIKPDNILIGNDGHIKLTDFGLSRTSFKGGEVKQESAADVYWTRSRMRGFSISEGERSKGKGGREKILNICKTDPNWTEHKLRNSKKGICRRNSAGILQPYLGSKEARIKDPSSVENENTSKRGMECVLCGRAIRQSESDSKKGPHSPSSFSPPLSEALFSAPSSSSSSDSSSSPTSTPGPVDQEILLCARCTKRLLKGQKVEEGKKSKKKRKTDHAKAQMFSCVGTPFYLAPEILLRIGHGYAVDWWGVGVMMYEMLTGNRPFQGDRPVDQEILLCARCTKRLLKGQKVEEGKKSKKKRKTDHAKAQMFSCVGTPFYLAPEILLRIGHGYAVDWWGVGVMMYEMLTGNRPFQGDSQEEIFEKLLKEPVSFPRDCVEGDFSISREARDLVKKLLTRDPEKRIGSRENASEIKSHLWFRDVNWNEVVRKKPSFIPFKAQMDEELEKDKKKIKKLEEEEASGKDMTLWIKEVVAHIGNHEKEVGKQSFDLDTPNEERREKERRKELARRERKKTQRVRKSKNLPTEHAVPKIQHFSPDLPEEREIPSSAYSHNPTSTFVSSSHPQHTHSSQRRQYEEDMSVKEHDPAHMLGGTMVPLDAVDSHHLPSVSPPLADVGGSLLTAINQYAEQPASYEGCVEDQERTIALSHHHPSHPHVASSSSSSSSRKRVKRKSSRHHTSSRHGYQHSSHKKHGHGDADISRREHQSSHKHSHREHFSRKREMDEDILHSLMPDAMQELDFEGSTDEMFTSVSTRATAAVQSGEHKKKSSSRRKEKSSRRYGKEEKRERERRERERRDTEFGEGAPVTLTETESYRDFSVFSYVNYSKLLGNQGM
ncbi:hypothetical protein ADUPG1_011916 [Aduncisulcus paluster]|uniref:non-specific serine/threonine protein kinase n=1 Tax=Aduncisulcus paluster TaxID=2918883 RepID=A0ABQ5JXK6_9EUKA|nr:hypothetical protein ADUPG1_011916 [Aduncisulcus paluster]